jgi:hypothetical protein
VASIINKIPQGDHPEWFRIKKKARWAPVPNPIVVGYLTVGIRMGVKKIAKIFYTPSFSLGQANLTTSKHSFTD